MRKTANILAMALGLGACASAPAQIGAQTAVSRAEKVASALEAAAQADEAGDVAALGNALRVVVASGARPLEDASEDPVPGWHERAGPGDPPMRGRPLGPGYRSGHIAAGGRDTFAQLFLSGTASTIALSSPSGDRVALRVLDQNEKPVCQRQASQAGACRWVPLFTQRYQIEVRNMGESDARYFLVVE